MAEARRLLHKYRIEKLLVVDDAYRCIGLITVKDIEKAKLHPNATRTTRAGFGLRPRPAWARTVCRAEALIDAEADVVVVDTAHGFTGPGCRRQDEETVKQPRLSRNIATPDGAMALIDAGADA